MSRCAYCGQCESDPPIDGKGLDLEVCPECHKPMPPLDRHEPDLPEGSVFDDEVHWNAPADFNED